MASGAAFRGPRTANAALRPTDKRLTAVSIHAYTSNVNSSYQTFLAGNRPSVAGYSRPAEASVSREEATEKSAGQEYQDGNAE